MESDKKIVLPEETQREMIKFFLKTSIPRKKRNSFLSKQEGQGKKEHGNK
ncbi:hypothetical protein LJC63_12920 [Ruminococcaceae bacterium OttesenSCG-928-L11]|nr:hypothetical protein [Ruminococcaceae bacterium OttesenSCG-928-L11]